MPDKQNESRFMALLERRGIVKKADSEDGPMELYNSDTIGSEFTEEELNSILSATAGDAMKVKPSARQPIPGSIKPIIPSERRPQSEHDQPITAMLAEFESPESVFRIEPEQSKSSEIPKADPFFGGIDLRDDFSRNAQPTAVPDAQFANIPQAPPNAPFAHAPPASAGAAFAMGVKFAQTEPAVVERLPDPPPAENHTERYLDVEELYEVLALKSKRTDSIYLIEEYLKTLPESLPDESRREIVSRIVSASGFDYDLLMGDGIMRVKMLKEYAERFAKHTDDYISARNAEVDSLEQQIMRMRRLIENRKELHKKQFFAIEAEAQRLKDILTFISG